MPVDGQSYDNTSKIEKTDSYKVLKDRLSEALIYPPIGINNYIKINK